MNPIEKLDAILKLLIEEVTLKPNAQDTSIFSALMAKYPTQIVPTEGSTFPRILEQLMEDKYVNFNQETYPIMGGGTGTYPKYYYITFKGELFYQRGGYKKQKRREAISIILQIFQAWAIAIGTILAAIGTLGLMYFEYLKHINSSCP